MPTSTDIKLPKSKRAIFPNACVVCGNESPNNKVKISTNSIGWWTILTWWFGERFSVRVPACKSCAFKLQARRWGALVLFAILAFFVLGVLDPLISPHVPKPMRKWALMISVMICLVPLFLLEIWFPPAIDLTAYSDTVDYEFRDEFYALQFSLLNRTDWFDDETDDSPTSDEFS